MRGDTGPKLLSEPLLLKISVKETGVMVVVRKKRFEEAGVMVVLLKKRLEEAGVPLVKK